MSDFDNAMLTVANRVKELMGLMKFHIEDRGIPTVLRVHAEEWTMVGEAAYDSKTHTVYFRYNEANPLPDHLIEQVIAHEMVHAYQIFPNAEDIVNDMRLDAYWEQSFEREAYTIQDLYNNLYLNGPENRTAYLDFIDTICDENIPSIVDMMVKFCRKHINII